jgi:hypothetical protein
MGLESHYFRSHLINKTHPWHDCKPMLEYKWLVFSVNVNSLFCVYGLIVMFCYLIKQSLVIASLALIQSLQITLCFVVFLFDGVVPQIQLSPYVVFKRLWHSQNIKRHVSDGFGIMFAMCRSSFIQVCNVHIMKRGQASIIYMITWLKMWLKNFVR